MFVLSIDPSELNTGVVFLQCERWGDKVLASTTRHAVQVVDWVACSAIYQHTIVPPDTILIERPAAGRFANAKTTAAYQLILWQAEKVWPGVPIFPIVPGNWKPLARAQKLKAPASLGDIHQRDAHLMFQVWRLTHHV